MTGQRINNFFLILVLTIIFSLSTATSGLAHGLWVNAHKNEVHSPGHVLASIGFGHFPPMDDLLTSDLGTLNIDAYFLVAPKGTVTNLPIPVSGSKKVETTSKLAITTGDVGACRIGFLRDSEPGTYLVAAKAKGTYFSAWIDKDGEVQRGLFSMDQLDHPKKIITSMLYRANAKTYFSVDKWLPPETTGWDLEITPLSDLSHVKPGDQVRFKVTFMGKPVTSGLNGFFTMTGISRTSGMDDKTFLMSYLQNGECSFIMPEPGQWLMQVGIDKKVDQTPELAKYKKKCQQVSYKAGLTFFVTQ